MLKRFYLLSFALAFLSLGAVAATLEITEDFQINNACGNPPSIVHDDINYWSFTFNSTVTNTGSGNLPSHAIFRYLTVNFYRSVPAGDIYEGSYELPYSRVSNTNNTFTFNTNDFPDLPTGDYVISIDAFYENRSGVPDGNIEMTVKLNGSTVCGTQTMTNDANSNGSGDVSCTLSNVTCFDYLNCFDLSVGSSKYGNTVSANISGSSGNYTIDWYIFQNGSNTVPYTFTGYTSVQKLCGTWTYRVRVTDNNTGCIRQVFYTVTRLCPYQIPIDRVGGRLGEETSPSFSLFPNPASSENVRIQYELPPEAAQASLALFNMQGQMVQEITLNLSSTEQKIKLNNLTKGVYVAILKVDGSRLNSQKLVIQ